MAARKLLLKGIKDVQEGRDALHVVRDSKLNRFPHLNVLSEVIASSSDWKAHAIKKTQIREWLTKDASEWFYEAVRHAVSVEFDRFIADGDLDKAKQRLAQIQQASNDSGGFLGMDV